MKKKENFTVGKVIGSGIKEVVGTGARIGDEAFGLIFGIKLSTFFIIIGVFIALIILIMILK